MKKVIIFISIVLVVVIGIFVFLKIDALSGASTSASTNTNVSFRDVRKSDKSGSKSYTANEVAVHDGASDCWTIIEGKVYNITTYLKIHPGGSVITTACGKDATNLFNHRSGRGSAHSMFARQILGTFEIGTLAT